MKEFQENYTSYIEQNSNPKRGKQIKVNMKALEIIGKSEDIINIVLKGSERAEGKREIYSRNKSTL